MREKAAAIIKSRRFLFACGLLLGVLIILGIRFFTYHHEEVHYHANFAVYINGRREEFKEPRYYQEVAMCTLETAITPVTRAHMHDNTAGVVHVEDHAVTWGQFFENLGWNLGPDFIQTADGTMYRATGQDKLHLMINGQDYTGFGLTNTVIKDRDRLLVSYGSADKSELRREYGAVPATAAKYDIQKDPSTCSGHGSATMRDRLKHLF